MEQLFFYVSKIIWLLVAPESLLLILLVAITLLLYRQRYQLAKRLLTGLTLLLLVVAFFPLGEWLLYPLESRFAANPPLPDKVDGIIVLSGAENVQVSHAWQQVELNQAAERDLAFMALARRYPQAKKIFTGGTGSLIHQQYKAADYAKQLFAAQGLDNSTIIFERDSRNTWQNAVFSKRLLQPAKGENWILITTAWHMPRSVGIFCKNDWAVIPWPVDHQTLKGDLFRVSFSLIGHLQSLQTAIKEWMGLFAYYLSGKTTALLPQRC